MKEGLDEFFSLWNNSDENNIMSKILLVEDEITYREVLADSIREIGITVIEAENGKEALSMLKGNKTDLILLDLIMPIMDGREFLKHFFNTPYKDTPVIVLTNLSDTNLPKRIPVITKVNTNIEDILSMVEKELRKN